jgi:hypothetical protein
MRENVMLFDETIRAAGARTVLYLTWARKYAPQTQQSITSAYRTIGSEIGATVVPVGVVWQEALRQRGCPVLYDKDGSHPTLAGSYLAACVFFGTLFGKRPGGWRPEGVDATDAALLQRAAAAAVS